MTSEGTKTLTKGTLASLSKEGGNIAATVTTTGFQVANLAKGLAGGLAVQSAASLISAGLLSKWEKPAYLLNSAVIQYNGPPGRLQL